jgi:hypothetical protein
MVADSGTCSTPVGAACRTVAGGPLVPVSLADDTGQLIAQGTVNIGMGEQWMMLATLDNMMQGRRWSAARSRPATPAPASTSLRRPRRRRDCP